MRSASVFAFRDDRSHKASSTLISDDERHLADVARSLAESIETLSTRADALRQVTGRKGTVAVERDMEIHTTLARLRILRRFSLESCLGRFVRLDEHDRPERVYVGRVGLTDAVGRVLLVDWRTPAAAPFFAATPADPMGLSSRRRFRWSQGVIVDYWDEAFCADPVEALALDEDSSFLASLSEGRPSRMRDVLGTIAADQDAVIRADSHGALVVDGGPGTGKTVVALHRAAYLLYSDPRLQGSRGGLLVVGPHEPYLAYVSDVLPSLGELDVATCTPADMVPEGATAAPDPDPVVAQIKADLDPAAVIDRAVRFYETPPTDAVTLETDWADVVLSHADWREAFGAPEAGTPHNEAIDDITAAVADIVHRRIGDPEVTVGHVRDGLSGNREFRVALARAWPMLSATDLVGDLWTVPAFLRLAAPQLDATQTARLQRDDPTAWTIGDLPLLDAARRRLGDAQASARRRTRTRVLDAQRAQMDQVVDDLLDSTVHDDGEGLMSMLRTQDLRDNLVDESAVDAAEADPFAGPFAHIVIDEAQELTYAQWRMLLSRCPSRSVTIVGDRAQARHGFTESWTQRLERVGLTDITLSTLTVNYRTPVEIMAEAEPAIRAALPDANVPTSIRESGIPVRHGRTDDLKHILENWLSVHEEGTACVIGDPTFDGRPRVRSLTPSLAKGLEFDLVVLIDPDRFGDDSDETITGAVDRYVAMTRATRELVILTDSA